MNNSELLKAILIKYGFVFDFKLCALWIEKALWMGGLILLASCSTGADTAASKKILAEVRKSVAPLPLKWLNIDGWRLVGVDYDSQGSVVDIKSYSPNCISNEVVISTNDLVFLFVNECLLPRVVVIDEDVIVIDDTNLKASIGKVEGYCFFKVETFSAVDRYRIRECSSNTTNGEASK